MQILGRCHCGNITFQLDWPADPPTIPARACTCAFCTRHGAAWTSHPQGVLTLREREPQQVSRYAFATRTAAFHLCARCGVVPVATSGIDGRLYAVVNVNTFENVDPARLQLAPVELGDEPEHVRLARRRRAWIGQVSVIG